mgnify:CR=1 FL=1
MEVALIIISTILASAFFSGVEIAFISSNRFHIELEQQKGTFVYRIIGYLVKNPSRFIAAMLVGNNIALVIYGLFMPLVLDPYLPLENAYLLLLVQTITVALSYTDKEQAAITNTRWGFKLGTMQEVRQLECL